MGKVAVVLLSGGLDSAVTAFVAREDITYGRGAPELYCLNFDYGQRHYEKESSCARALVDTLGASLLELRVSLDHLLGKEGSALLDKESELPESSKDIPATWVPQRNSIFLAMAFGYAEVVGAQSVYIGANQIDYSGYPDCRFEFLERMEDALNYGSADFVQRGKRIKLEAPILQHTKAGVVALGQRLGVPFGHTWSCYRGAEKACGRCDSCQIRLKAFKEAGLEDPIEYETME